MIPHGSSSKSRFQSPRPWPLVLLLVLAALAVAGSWIAPRASQAQADVRPADDDEMIIGLPAPVYGDPLGHERIMYRDSTISINNQCPVRKGRIDPHREPVYVNGRPIGFCCHPCPGTFSMDPEKYLRAMKVTLRCPVRPARRALFDSSLRRKLNQDIYFFSSPEALKRFEKDPLRYCGKLTDPVSHARFQPTKGSPHVVFRGRDYYFASDSTQAKFQAEPQRYYERAYG